MFNRGMSTIFMSQKPHHPYFTKARQRLSKRIVVDCKSHTETTMKHSCSVIPTIFVAQAFKDNDIAFELLISIL